MQPDIQIAGLLLSPDSLGNLLFTEMIESPSRNCTDSENLSGRLSLFE
jgi:hypothetical protein